MTELIKANVISGSMNSVFCDGIGASISIPKLSAYDLPR